MLTPTSRQLERLVWGNLETIGKLSRAMVGAIVVNDLQRQNAHSSRIGGEIRIRLGASDREIRLWAKRVDNPAAAFSKMRAAYERAAEHGLAGSIPKPYFFDQQWKLVFMEKAYGASLRNIVFRHAISPMPAQTAALGRIMYRIGRWLCCYHRAVKVDATFDAHHLIAQIECRLDRDESLSKTGRERVAEHLCQIRHSLQRGRVALDRAWPHNDFTLRNLLVVGNGRFITLDWDAMAHPAFSETTNGLWDVTLFLLNLYSLDRFGPIARASRLRELGEAFLSGYLDAACADDRRAMGVTMNTLIYLFVMRFWYGIGVDRPFHEVYRPSLGWRYARRLRQRLALGPAHLFAA